MTETGQTPEVERVSITYSQQADSEAPDGFQELRVEAVDAGAGHYLVLSTERWAVDPDDLDGFLALLRRVLTLTEVSHAD